MLRVCGDLTASRVLSRCFLELLDIRPLRSHELISPCLLHCRRVSICTFVLVRQVKLVPALRLPTTVDSLSWRRWSEACTKLADWFHGARHSSSCTHSAPVIPRLPLGRIHY